MFTPLTNDPRRRARIITGEIIAVGIIIIAAMWVMAAASIMAAREAAMDRTRSEGRNLTAAFAGEVTHNLEGVTSAMETIARRMRAAPDQVDVEAWVREIPLLANPAIPAAIIGPDGRRASTALRRAPQPLDLGDREYFRIHRDGRFQGLFIGKPVTGSAPHETVIH